MQRVRCISIEADVDKELSQFMWHSISGRLSHGIFPDSVVFKQIQRDSSQLESGVLYAVDCFQVLKALGSFDIDSEAMAFHLFETPLVERDIF